MLIVKKTNPVCMIPLVHDLRGRRVVIAGGGAVGARKAAYFEGECEVVVLSRSFHPSFAGMAVECVKVDISATSDTQLRPYVRGSALVIAATSDEEVNNRLLELCREENVHCNNARGIAGDVILPAMIRGDEYCIAITTMGKSPAMSRFIREKIEDELAGVDDMITLQHNLRAELKEKIAVQDERAKILAAILEDPEIRDALEMGVVPAQELALRKYCP